MNEQKLNNKEILINPNKTKGQIDCLVINFLAEGEQDGKLRKMLGRCLYKSIT